VPESVADPMGFRRLGCDARSMPHVIDLPAETIQESVEDQACVGRFSEGLETMGPTPEKLRRGRFSDGLEHLPQRPPKRHLGRFSDGLERLPLTRQERRHGSFADRSLGS
jgi:hypothetical protein